MKDSLKIFYNFFIIGLSYSSNLLLPLLLIPHFINKLGIELYGIVTLSQALMVYLTVIIEYHFSTIVVKDVSVNRNDRTILNEIFCRSLVVRFLLLLISLIIVVLVTTVYPPFKSHYEIVLLSSMIIIGQTLLPNWFLLGLEEVGAIAVLNIVFKGIYIILALTLVNTYGDARLPNFFLGVTNFIAGTAGIIYIFNKYKFTFRLPDKADVWLDIKAGRLMTISNISVAIYTSGGPLILALYYNSKIVGEYVAAERIVALFRGIANVYFQATYARAAALMAEGKEVLNKFYKSTFPFVITAVVVGCTVFFFESDLIMHYIFRIQSPAISEYLRYMIVVIIIIIFNIPYYQRLLIAAPHKANLIIMSGCVISISLNFLLVPFLGPIGCIIAVITTELYITLGLYYLNIKNNLL